MGKLHEVLAVESGLKSVMDKVVNEAKDSFVNKRGHFLAQNRHYESLVENGLTFPDENKSMVTTIKDKLDYVKGHFIKAIDCIFQKEVTNTKAQADLVVNGELIAKDVPATFLLTLEGRLKELRSLYEHVPTLDPGGNWAKDSTRDNVYVSDETVQHKTEKVVEPLVLYPATEKHPAQVDKITMDKIVGKWTTKVWSGNLSSSEKSKLLGKIDELIRSAKQARMRANGVEVEKNLKICDKIFNYINK